MLNILFHLDLQDDIDIQNATRTLVSILPNFFVTAIFLDNRKISGVMPVDDYVSTFGTNVKDVSTPDKLLQFSESSSPQLPGYINGFREIRTTGITYVPLPKYAADRVLRSTYENREFLHELITESVSRQRI